MDFHLEDEQIFEDHPWASNLKESLSEFTNKCLLNWCKIIIELGEHEINVNEWSEIFKNQIEERYKELYMDVVYMKERVVNNITDLLSKIHSNCQHLGIEENVYDINPNEKYFKVEAELTKKLEDLEEVMKKRRLEVDTLLSKQKKLCAILEKTYHDIDLIPLPSSDRIDKLQQYVATLEDEKFQREERYICLKESINKMAKELELIPKTDFEREFLSNSEQNINITKSHMEAMEKYREDLNKQLQDMKEEIDQIRKNLDELWAILEESITEREDFNEKYSGYSVASLKALKAEMKRCEQLKKANIKIFVEKLRVELRSLWQMCFHQNVEELGNYPWFTSDFYTEDLLFYHETEVTKWRTFYNSNEELIKLFAEHEKLWNKLLSMENKDLDGMNRYKNRGGQLLQEERERNKLSKKIPQIEDKIKNLALEYEELHCTSFEIFGVPILDHIENLHVQRDLDRKNKLCARKQIREQETITPAKSCLSLFPLTPQPISTVKRKLTKPQTTGKKPKIEVLNSKQTFKSVDPVRLNRSKRLSREKNKRIASCRRHLQMKPLGNKENINTTNITDYDAFEENLTTREDNCRSTLNILESHSPMKAVPAIVLIPSTPRTTRTTPQKNKIVTPKTPKSDKKRLVKATSTLKLLF